MSAREYHAQHRRAGTRGTRWTVEGLTDHLGRWFCSVRPATEQELVQGLLDGDRGTFGGAGMLVGVTASVEGPVVQTDYGMSWVVDDSTVIGFSGRPGTAGADHAIEVARHLFEVERASGGHVAGTWWYQPPSDWWCEARSTPEEGRYLCPPRPCGGANGCPVCCGYCDADRHFCPGCGDEGHHHCESCHQDMIKERSGR